MTRAEKEAQLLKALTRREKEYWARGMLVGGMDEVGRGPLAGPVVVCAIVMPPLPLISGVNDSKKVSELKRERLYGEICAVATGIGLGVMDETIIDRDNILVATRAAFVQAYAQLDVRTDLMMIDALTGLDLPVRQEILIHGDAQSYLIAAASIVAKVTRDHMMIEYDAQYPQYGFAQNKGYGTAQHIAALKKHGPCPIHRRSFIRNFL